MSERHVSPGHGPLVTALLCRNEADRDLATVLTRCLSFSTTVCVLDDRSTDDSPKIARSLGCEVRERSILKDPAWGREAPARAELFAWGTEVAGDGWLLICDADQILEGDPRPYTKSWDANTICIPLFDMWTATEFRTDTYWGAFSIARPWMVRPAFVPDGWQPEWNVRRLHAGHLPTNWPIYNPIIAPDLYWRHLAYASPERRIRKHEQYMSKKECLTPAEVAHAASILD